jgi:hypothetical protein
VLACDLGPADAVVVSQVLNVKLRALELERTWKELEERLEVLEGAARSSYWRAGCQFRSRTTS